MSQQIYKATVSVRLTVPMLTFVDIQSIKRNVSRSDVIEDAVAFYAEHVRAIEKKEQETKMAHLLEKEAGKQ